MKVHEFGLHKSLYEIRQLSESLITSLLFTMCGLQCRFIQTLSCGCKVCERNVKVHSYHIAIALRCRYDISAASHCSIIAFQVEINLTFMRHRNAVTSHECAVHQRNTIAVQYEQTVLAYLSPVSTGIYQTNCRGSQIISYLILPQTFSYVQLYLQTSLSMTCDYLQNSNWIYNHFIYIFIAKVMTICISCEEIYTPQKGK